MDNFNILPAEIISDILTRVPAESVICCKLVSNIWRNHIQHPLFSQMHLNRVNHDADSGRLGFIALNTDMTQLYYFECIENQETPIDRVSKINLTPPFKCYTFAGSFNGLICLRGRKERFCICNPITKEYVILPQPKIRFGRYRWIGFGYLHSTNEYKVVVVHKLEKEPNFVEVMVYTLSSGNGWRNMGKFNLKCNYYFEGHGFFANGALHWMHKKSRLILVFDLVDEKFLEHLAPPPLPTGSSLDLGVLSGFVFCAHRYFCSVNIIEQYLCCDIWLYKKKNDYSNMEEQDENQSWGWSKEFTAACTIPLAFTKSGAVLSYSSRYLSIYDPETFNPKRRVYYKEEFHQVFPHKNTLVSLKELGEEGTKIMESVKMKKRKGSD